MCQHTYVTQHTHMVLLVFCQLFSAAVLPCCCIYCREKLMVLWTQWVGPHLPGSSPSLHVSICFPYSTGQPSSSFPLLFFSPSSSKVKHSTKQSVTSVPLHGPYSLSPSLTSQKVPMDGNQLPRAAFFWRCSSASLCVLPFVDENFVDIRKCFSLDEQTLKTSDKSMQGQGITSRTNNSLLSFSLLCNHSVLSALSILPAVISLI